MGAVAKLFHVFIEVRISGRGGIVGIRVTRMGGIIITSILAGAILIGTMSLRI